MVCFNQSCEASTYLSLEDFTYRVHHLTLAFTLWNGSKSLYIERILSILAPE